MAIDHVKTAARGKAERASEWSGKHWKVSGARCRRHVKKFTRRLVRRLHKLFDRLG